MEGKYDKSGQEVKTGELDDTLLFNFYLFRWVDRELSKLNCMLHQFM